MTDTKNDAPTYGNIASPISLWKEGRCDSCFRKLKKVAGTVRISRENNRYVCGPTSEPVQVRGVGPECLKYYGPELEKA